MTYVALAVVAALVVTSAAWASLTRSLIRQQARERELLLNQICNLAGRPWAPPPADLWVPPADDEEMSLSSAENPDWS